MHAVSPPSISVLLPVYDGTATLQRAIQSIREQTLADWELIVVNDGSTDGTAKMLADCAAEDIRIRVFTHTRNRGIVSALLTGLEQARAPYIARMDADDLCAPERLEQQRDFLDAHPDIGLVGCRVRFGGDRATHAGYAAYVDWTNTLLEPEEIALNRFVESPFAHPSVAFRRELPECFGSYRDGDFPEDYELWLRWLDAGVRMAKLP
ncbi:MAG: glycosyltransferase family 2 protein, partial [Lentisphaeria bacterium]|nr:glycosyltransferase family 2 protein [Lentisphaeria bacterium]